jgi:hypothetical protein
MRARPGGSLICARSFFFDSVWSTRLGVDATAGGATTAAPPRYMRDDRGLWPALLLMAMAMAMGEADLQLHASIFLARGYLGLLGHMLSSTSITADPLRVLLLGVRRVWMHDASPFFPFDSTLPSMDAFSRKSELQCFRF